MLLLVIDDLSAQPLQMKGLLNSASREDAGDARRKRHGWHRDHERSRAGDQSHSRSRSDPRRTARQGPGGPCGREALAAIVTVNEAFDIARPAGDPDTLGLVIGRECGNGASSGAGEKSPMNLCPARRSSRT